MTPSKQELQLNCAMAALRRIERTQDNQHKKEDAKLNSCRCPQCEARDALEQIMAYEQAEFVKEI